MIIISLSLLSASQGLKQQPPSIISAVSNTEEDKLIEAHTLTTATLNRISSFINTTVYNLTTSLYDKFRNDFFIPWHYNNFSWYDETVSDPSISPAALDLFQKTFEKAKAQTPCIFCDVARYKSDVYAPFHSGEGGAYASDEIRDATSVAEYISKLTMGFLGLRDNLLRLQDCHAELRDPFDWLNMDNVSVSTKFAKEAESIQTHVATPEELSILGQWMFKVHVNSASDTCEQLWENFAGSSPALVRSLAAVPKVNSSNILELNDMTKMLEQQERKLSSLTKDFDERSTMIFNSVTAEFEAFGHRLRDVVAMFKQELNKVNP